MLSNMTINPHLVPKVGLIDYNEEFKDKFKYKLPLIVLLFIRTILTQLIDPLIITSIKQSCNSGDRLSAPNSFTLCTLGFCSVCYQ